MREVKLPSGATLKIGLAPFADSKALYQALLAEGKGIELNAGTDTVSLFKQFFCSGFSSKEIEQCLWKCMERCTYNGGKGDLKIDQDTFEPVEAREDFLVVCIEVGKENVSPFLKSLFVEYERFLAMMPNIQT